MVTRRSHGKHLQVEDLLPPQIAGKTSLFTIRYLTPYSVSLAFAILLMIVPSALAQLPTGTKPPPALERPISIDRIPDERLEERIRAVFSAIEEFKSLKVDVENGVVHLSGKAASYRTTEKAVELVYRFENVVYVDNNIEQEAEVETRITPTLRKAQQIVNRTVRYLPIIGVAIAAFLAFWLLSILLTRWDRLNRRLVSNALMRNLIRQVLRLIIVLMGVIIAMEILDLTAVAGAILGAAGVFGLALGFALRDIAENYLAGVIMSISSPFSVNDYISVGEHEGSVVRLTTRELVLMTLDGNHLRIPNSQIFKSTICNYTRNPLRRFSFPVGIGNDEDLAHVQRVGAAALKAMKGVMSEPTPFMRVQEFGEYNMVVRFFGWVDQREFDFLKVQSEAMRILKTALDAAGISMPEPIKTLHLRGIAPEIEAREMVEPKTRPAVPLEEEAVTADVTREPYLDRQIERDRAASDETNLLEEKDSGGHGSNPPGDG